MLVHIQSFIHFQLLFAEYAAQNLIYTPFLRWPQSVVGGNRWKLTCFSVAQQVARFPPQHRLTPPSSIGVCAILLLRHAILELLSESPGTDKGMNSLL